MKRSSAFIRIPVHLTLTDILSDAQSNVVTCGAIYAMTIWTYNIYTKSAWLYYDRKRHWPDPIGDGAHTQVSVEYQRLESVSSIGG